jgi:hypothetical protein
MEKETYKKAREILQKYDPARFKQLEVSWHVKVIVTASVV